MAAKQIRPAQRWVYTAAYQQVHYMSSVFVKWLAIYVYYIVLAEMSRPQWDALSHRHSISISSGMEMILLYWHPIGSHRCDTNDYRKLPAVCITTRIPRRPLMIMDDPLQLVISRTTYDHGYDHAWPVTISHITTSYGSAGLIQHQWTQKTSTWVSYTWISRSSRFSTGHFVH